MDGVLHRLLLSSHRVLHYGVCLDVLGPAQRITREEALAMWTRNAARILRWQGIGTLAPGDHADLIVVDRDPLTCPVEQIGGTRVDLTLLGGEPVYRSGGLPF